MGPSFQVHSGTILKRVCRHLRAEGRRQRIPELRGLPFEHPNTMAEKRQFYGMDRHHLLQMVFERVCGVLVWFGLMFLLWKPIALYLMEETEEINCEQSFLQKPIFHRVKNSYLPLRILHTVNRYKALTFTAQSTVSNWELLQQCKQSLKTSIIQSKFKPTLIFLIWHEDFFPIFVFFLEQSDSTEPYYLKHQDALTQTV